MLIIKGLSRELLTVRETRAACICMTVIQYDIRMPWSEHGGTPTGDPSFKAHKNSRGAHIFK